MSFRSPRIPRVARPAGAVLFAAVAGAAQAEVTGNIGVTSNYVWRGVTQTNDGAAIQGGLDYVHASGLYLGTWTSNVDFADPAGSPATRSEFELDLYGGYAGSAGAFGYDIGLIHYAYPLTDDVDFTELAASASYEMVSVGAHFTISGQADEPSAFTDGDVYVYASGSFDLGGGFGLGVTLGSYSFDNLSAGADDQYVHYNVTVSKAVEELGEIGLALDVNDQDGEFPSGKQADDPRISIMWSTAF